MHNYGGKIPSLSDAAPLVSIIDVEFSSASCAIRTKVLFWSASNVSGGPTIMVCHIDVDGACSDEGVLVCSEARVVCGRIENLCHKLF